MEEEEYSSEATHVEWRTNVSSMSTTAMTAMKEAWRNCSARAKEADSFLLPPARFECAFLPPLDRVPCPAAADLSVTSRDLVIAAWLRARRGA